MNNLDIATELRQHHSGSALWTAIIQALLDKFSSTLMCAVRDWTPCDDQLALAVSGASAEVKCNFNCAHAKLNILNVWCVSMQSFKIS